MRAQEFIPENMDHSKDGQAVSELRAALLSHQDRLQKASDDQVYAIIDRIMTRIARSHSISGQKLHDIWVDRYKEIPDTWIMNQQLDEGAAEHVRQVMTSAADLMKQHGFRAVGQLSEKDLEQIAQQAGATLHDVCIILNIDHVDERLDELSFLGSPCTKDCSGHRAGYAWSQSKGGRVAQSPFSPSFNNGSQLQVDGK